MADELFTLYSRLFNPRPFVQGETRQFVKEFETKRKGDADVHKVFQILEKVTELKDAEVDKLKAQCESTVTNVNANLLVAQSMCKKILDQSQASEIEQALESSRVAREKDWAQFSTEIKSKCNRIDDVYKQKEAQLRAQYQQLEKELVEEEN